MFLIKSDVGLCLNIIDAWMSEQLIQMWSKLKQRQISRSQKLLFFKYKENKLNHIEVKFVSESAESRRVLSADGHVSGDSSRLVFVFLIFFFPPPFKHLRPARLCRLISHVSIVSGCDLSNFQDSSAAAAAGTLCAWRRWLSSASGVSSFPGSIWWKKARQRGKRAFLE